MVLTYHFEHLETFLFLSFVVAVNGYNLDLRVGSAKFMTSPVLQALGKTTTGSPILELSSDTPPSFYGYEMNMIMPNDQNELPRLMVGAPKMTDSSNPGVQRSPSKRKKGEEPKFRPHGAVNSCPVQKSFFTSNGGAHPTCSLANPTPTQPGDGFGTSVATNPDGEMSACSPGRSLQCTADKFNPGYCYSSENYGGEWEMDAHSKAIECPESTVDLLFVLDGSGSVSGHFQTVKNWVKSITEKVKSQMRTGYIQVGVVQYSHYYENKPWSEQKFIKTEIKIGNFNSYDDFAKAVDAIQLQNYTTHTGRALKKVAGDFKRSSRFTRKKNSQMMFLLTDGKSIDSKYVKKNADALRSMGVKTYAVGVKGADVNELRLIATGNPTSKERVYNVAKFSELNSLVDELQETINFALEGGGSSKTASYKLEQAQTGFSSAYEDKKNGRLYLGAVGAYDWSGTVTKYDDVNDDQPDIPNYAEVQKVLPDRTKESYMGYSVTTGNFVDRNTEYVATGAPRYKLMGAVVVYRPINNDASFNDHVTLMGNKQQLGSYFGGSVLSTDVNGDGLDDLLVGAPLYVHENFDEGRVFVFISTGANTLNGWKAASYAPLELSGDNLPGGRFGTAMADAGDLNRDGYNDVIVGAPLTDTDRGAVFVYHGTQQGIDTEFKQKILASEMTGVTLKYFGQSLQGGVDLDGNKYPDIAVGAPKSDTVVIFRSRPVVIIVPEIKYYDNTIDIFDCIDKNYENCSRVEVCFNASGVSVENTIGIKFNVTIDTQKVGADKRLQFREGQENPKPTWSQEVNLTRDIRNCFTKDLHMKRSVKDYDSGIITEVEYDLLSSHTARPLSSVRDPSISNKKNATLNLIKNCGAEGKCVYDLRIDASLNVPEYKNEKQEDLTDGGKVLVVDQKTADTPVTVKVNLSNNGENAFDTRIKVTYTSLISLSAFTNKVGYPASNSCVVEDSDPVDQGNGFRMQILRYNYKTNIMRPSAWCYFEFSLIIENLRKNGDLETFSVNVTAYTSDSSSSSEEKNPVDNSWALSPQVRYRSDFNLKKKKESQISFNYTTEAANITSITEIGNGTQDIEVEFELNGKGYSNIPRLSASLTYPLKTSHGDRLLYLYKVECAPKQGNGKASCSCDQSLVNPYKLTLEVPNENNTNGSYVETFPPRRPIEASSFDCYTSGKKNFTCETLKCTVKDLFQSDQIIFKAYFRLWKSSITFNGSNFKEELNLHSQFEVNTNNSQYIIDENGNKSQSKSHEIVWVAKKFESSTPPEASQNLWIYIVAAIGGLLLLIILVVILWRVGFFKSKYADMKKDAQEDIADETEFAGNANGSQG